MAKAGVYVVEMCKEVFQPELTGITVLNLWHGVGCKSIERKVTNGFLQERIAKKYIQNNDILRNNQLFLVTSEIMEKHFKEQCGIDDDKVIRAGYPRCVVNDNIQSYDHDIRKKKGLPADTKLAIYCPTYRDNNGANFMKSALPDMKRLAEVLHENNILLILKMHPLVEKDSSLFPELHPDPAAARMSNWHFPGCFQGRFHKILFPEPMLLFSHHRRLSILPGFPA